MTLPKSENYRIAKLMNASANGYKNKERFWECMERSSNIVLIKTSRVTEGKYVDYLSELVKRKVVTVGPLLQEPANKDGDGEKVMEWLNKKQLSSVVLVSLGVSTSFLKKRGRRLLMDWSSAMWASSGFSDFMVERMLQYMRLYHKDFYRGLGTEDWLWKDGPHRLRFWDIQA